MAAPTSKIRGPSARQKPQAEGMPLLKLTPPSDYTVIPVSRQTLMCGVGEVDGRRVLAPYVQLQLFRTPDLAPSDGGALEPAFQTSVSFENLAFLITDLAQDFGATTRDLAEVSSGVLQSEPNRLDYAVEVLGSAVANIQATIELLKVVSSAAKISRAAAQDADRSGSAAGEPQARSATKGGSARRPK